MVRATLQNMLETWEDAERTMRRKMRIYPPLNPATIGARFPNHPLLRRRHEADQDAEDRRWQDARANAIISVHGKDISSEDEIEDAPEKPADKRDKAA